VYFEKRQLWVRIGMSSRRNPFSLAVVLMPLRAASAQKPQPPTFLNFEGDYK
jgi:hypothetical protein